jgi:protein-S-isoprenylcysteine O-methyltransferase Ste14
LQKLSDKGSGLALEPLEHVLLFSEPLFRIRNASMHRKTILWVWVPLVLGPYVLWRVFISKIGPQGPLRWLGLLLCVLGWAGVCLARYTLGRSFSIRPKATALVTTGIYSRIRNPVYIFGEILLAGVAIILWSPYLVVMMIALIPIQVLRARTEARVLEEKFGEEYRAYRRRTWF